jgi:cytochrome c5
MTMSEQVRIEVYVPGYVLFVRLSRPLILLAALAVWAQFLPQPARAQSGERSGKDVVDAVCSGCHGTGANGAPKIGDKRAWSKLESRGLSSLTQSALKGVRKMPAHGGNAAVSDLEISRAITYMVNQSGGHWTEPISKKSPPADRSGGQIVRSQCVKCHQNGDGGAPKIGDRSAWIARASPGLDAVVRSAIKGHGGMPARGGMPDLTDAEMRKATIYMLNQGTGAAK